MKKTLALLLVVFTLIAQLSMVTVSADAATVTVGTVTAEAGEVVEIDVVMENCIPFNSLALEFDYDKDYLTLLSISNGIADVKPTAGKDIATIPYNVLWDSAEAVDGNGVILTLEFEVSANAVAGTTYPVSVDFYKGRKGNYVDGEDCNYYMDDDFITYPLDLTYVGGGITIPAPVVPDTPVVPGAPEIPEFEAPSTAYVKVDDYADYVEAGDIIEIDVSMGNSIEFNSLALEFDYDKDALSLLSISNGIADVKPTAGKDIATIPYNVLWDSAEAVDGNGVIITLEFEVNAEAVTGVYEIGVDFYKGRKGNYVDGEDCNYYMDDDFITHPLNLSYYGGIVSIKGAAAPVVPTEYKLEATVAGNGVAIAAEGPAMEGKIIAALYNGKDLAQVKIFDAAADLTATFTKSGDKIKVMWWDGMLTAKPLCYSVELPLN